MASRASLACLWRQKRSRRYHFPAHASACMTGSTPGPATQHGLAQAPIRPMLPPCPELPAPHPTPR